jgi:hypothetical protein
VCPAIVAVPARVLPVLFAVALRITLPPPVPDCPDVTVSQAALLAAVHGQPAAVKTNTVEAVVPAPAVTLRGDMVYEHVPAWEIWKSELPIEIVALRTDTLELAPTVKPIVPEPVPDAPDVNVTQLCEAVADQLQPEPIVTSTV